MIVLTETTVATTLAEQINHHHELASLRAEEAVNHAIAAGKPNRSHLLTS